MDQEIFEEIRDIMVEETGLDADKVTADAELVTDLDLNSLEMMNIVMAVEEQMDVTLDEHYLNNIRTVSDLVDYISELRN